MDMNMINQMLQARGIQGFGQQAAPAAPASRPSMAGGLSGLVQQILQRKFAQRRAAQQPQGQGTMPVGAPVPVNPAPPAMMPPRANPQPFASQFDWSKFANTGNGQMGQ